MPAPAKSPRAGQRLGPDGRPAELSDLEKLVFPRWLDHDGATGGPSYLGYVMAVLVVALPLVFLLLALALIW